MGSLHPVVISNIFLFCFSPHWVKSLFCFFKEFVLVLCLHLIVCLSCHKIPLLVCIIIGLFLLFSSFSSQILLCGVWPAWKKITTLPANGLGCFWHQATLRLIFSNSYSHTNLNSLAPVCLSTPFGSPCFWPYPWVKEQTSAADSIHFLAPLGNKDGA